MAIRDWSSDLCSSDLWQVRLNYLFTWRRRSAIRLRRYAGAGRRNSRQGLATMALRAVSLDDKYAPDRGRVFLTGTQALVRLPMMQRQRDLAAGLDTAAYVTGYRGPPLRPEEPRVGQGCVRPVHTCG